MTIRVIGRTMFLIQVIFKVIVVVVVIVGNKKKLTKLTLIIIKKITTITIIKTKNTNNKNNNRNQINLIAFPNQNYLFHMISSIKPLKSSSWIITTKIKFKPRIILTH